MPELFTGTTESGKTTLARYLARKIDTNKFPIIVRDPVADTKTAGGGWPEEAEVYSDDTEFFERIVELIRERRPAYVFIDEAADLFSLSSPENFWLATRGRHYNLYIAFITQRPKLIAPSVRGQCNRVYMFRLSRADMREILADCGHELEIVEKPLDQGDFMVLNTGSAEFQRLNVFQLVAGKSAKSLQEKKS